MTEVADPIQALLDGKVQTVEFSNGNVVVDAPRSGRVYMAGSFNPLHDGHRGMLAAALKARQDKQGWLSFALWCLPSTSHKIAAQCALMLVSMTSWWTAGVVQIWSVYGSIAGYRTSRFSISALRPRSVLQKPLY